MQENTWNEKETLHGAGKQSIFTCEPPAIQTAQDCQILGHDWQATELHGVKQCNACSMAGYCPGCTTNPPLNALPFSCTAHTRIESNQVQE